MTSNILSHHENTIKTTEKLSLPLRILQGDYHNIPTNHNHHIPSVIQASSFNRSTMEQLPTVDSSTKSLPSVHHTPAIKQSHPITSTSHPPWPHSSYCPDIPIQGYHMLDHQADTVPNTLKPCPNESDDLSFTNMHFSPTEFSICPECPETPPATNRLSTFDFTANNSFDECMQQQECSFLATMAKIQQNLLLAQQEFEEKMQILIKHCSIVNESQLLHQSVLRHPIVPFLPKQPEPNQNKL